MTKNKPGMILGILFFIVGFGLVGWRVWSLSLLQIKKVDLKDQTSSTSTEQLVTEPFRLVFVSDEMVNVWKSDGTKERVLKNQLGTTGISLSDLKQGVAVSNGIPQNPAGSRVALLDGRSDGASVVEVQRPGESVVKVTMRDERGLPIEQANFIGWLQETAVLTGVMNGQRKVFQITPENRVRVIADVPENAMWLQTRGDWIWMGTVTLGQGIETPPQAPASLWRVGLDGKIEKVLDDTQNVFTSVVAHDESFCVTRENGETDWHDRTGQLRFHLGHVRPLTFLPQGNLLVRDGFQIKYVEKVTGIMQVLGEIPEGELQLYLL